MNEQWREVANVFDPKTGAVSSMPAWRWSTAQRAGLVITYTVTAR